VSPGLVRMLEMISANFKDSMLVDRFLVLASDMPEHEKVEATLQLARTLQKKSPRKAMEIAWMVYNSSLSDAESLAVIADAFDGLGKQGKADIVRSELKRITNGSLSPEVRNLARLTVEEHVTTTLAGKDHSPWAGQEGASESPISTFDLENPPSLFEPGPVSRPPQNPDSTLILDPMVTLGPLDVMSDVSLGYDSSEPKANVKTPKAAAEKQPSHAASIEIASAAMPSAGLPEAIPPREPSKHYIAPKVRDVKSKAQSVTQASMARSNMEPTPKIFAVEEQLSRLEELAKAEQWDRLMEGLNSWFPNGDHPYLLAYFERLHLHRIDIAFADYWLNVLIAAQQERRALRFIVTRLTEEPQLAWARMVLPKVHRITDLMDLDPIQWRESDGVLVLRDKVARQRPRAGCYWAA